MFGIDLTSSISFFVTETFRNSTMGVPTARSLHTNTTRTPSEEFYRWDECTLYKMMIFVLCK